MAETVMAIERRLSISTLSLALSLSILSTLWCGAAGNAQKTKTKTDAVRHLRHAGDVDGNGSRRARLTSEFAVRITEGDSRARQIALEDGFVYDGKIMDEYYLFRRPGLSSSSRTRTRRAAFRRSSLESETLRRLADDSRILWFEQQIVKVRTTRAVRPLPRYNDPMWFNLWYIVHPNGTNAPMNILNVWQRNLTGAGVVIGIIDDGIDANHLDLADNLDKKHSVSFVSPKALEHSLGHGTRCAGVVAAKADNAVCTVGIAHNARIVDIHLLDSSKDNPDVTDASEAQAFSHMSNYIDIYSASFGPPDTGEALEGPGELARKALLNGITKGRKGLGSIFIWASGNGGSKDNCNCDGYSSSIYTISISGVSDDNMRPWYSEQCSSILASTYSSGNQSNKQVISTDMRNSCVNNHTGTSASAPIAASICALVLQANPHLTWRDMQHLIVLTSNPNDLHADDHVANGVGRIYSHIFGYGILDAEKMVNVAQRWQNVPAQRVCSTTHSTRTLLNAQHKLQTTLRYPPQCCSRQPSNDCSVIRYLEHVVVKLTIANLSNRGQLEVSLRSPSGSVSRLLTKRHNDKHYDPFRDWPFMSVMFWGEKPRGNWVLEIYNGQRTNATLLRCEFIFYGTSEQPYNYSHLGLDQPTEPDRTAASFNESEFTDGDGGGITDGANQRTITSVWCEYEKCAAERSAENGAEKQMSGAARLWPSLSCIGVAFLTMRICAFLYAGSPLRFLLDL